MKHLIVASFTTCLILVAHCHDHLELGPDADRHFHENQIPPPERQPSKDDIKNMLTEVFSLMDKNQDKFVNGDELKNWLEKVHVGLIDENINQQWDYYNPEVQEVHSWETYDPENREAISWEHYVKTTYPEDVITAANGSESNPDVFKSDDPNFKSYFIMYKRAEKRWKAADANNDNVLVKEEFKNFIHPEESDNSKHILVEEAMEDMDLDSNGEITLEEYIKHMKEVSSPEEKEDPNFVLNQQSQFTIYLDKNKDSVLNQEELTEWLVPNYDRHEAEAVRMIHETDNNQDQLLTEDEILNNDEYFLSLIPAEFWRKFSGESDATTPSSHDEF